MLHYLIPFALLAVWAAMIGRRALAVGWKLRPQHYLQAIVQSSIFLYWGAYWPLVYEHAPRLVAQVAFAYAFDLLLGWTRRGAYTFTLGILPIVFSVNLFLWFRPEWFALQFVLIAACFAAKEFLRWTRDGASVHIFNPSSFPLALASLALIVSGAHGITNGPEIATTQFYPPQMYAFLFLVALPSQTLFGVAAITLPAVATVWLYSMAYHAATGIYFFYDTHIPIAVFLGMHLLITDPSTAPRRPLARMVFGVLYGASTIVLYQLLGMFGLPTFYDKLLQVPLLNLSVRWLDGWAERIAFAPPKPVFAAAWAAAFAALSVWGGLNDRHPGQFLPFWREACQQGRAYACPYLADLDLTYCARGSAYACNEAGLMHVALARSGEDARRAELAGAARPFEQGCRQGLAAACENGRTLAAGRENWSAPQPQLADWPIILQSSKGPVTTRDEAELLGLACAQGWRSACR